MLQDALAQLPRGAPGARPGVLRPQADDASCCQAWNRAAAGRCGIENIGVKAFKLSGDPRELSI